MPDPIIPTVVAPSDNNRNTTNVALPQEVSAEIWAKTIEDSAFMQLARQIVLPGPGVTIQTITGDPDPDWVNETHLKAVGKHTFGKKNITPYKLSVIEPFSDEFRRDAASLYAECVRRLPRLLGRKFDNTIIGTTAPGSNFDVLGGCTKQAIKGKTYEAFVAADAAISANGGVMDGIALAPQGRSVVLSALDGQNRPLFTAGVNSGTVGDILGAHVQISKGVYSQTSGSAANIVGIAGDFEDAVFGTVEGVKLDITDQATLVTEEGIIALWQQNMFAVRVEIEVGFAVKDTNNFVLLTDATNS